MTLYHSRFRWDRQACRKDTVYCWVKNRPSEPFAVRDLMGGENFDWNGTPLQVLYDKHIKADKDEETAIKAAAIDLGWLVKNLLSEDRRTFETKIAGLVRSYNWVGNEQ